MTRHWRPGYNYSYKLRFEKVKNGVHPDGITKILSISNKLANILQNEKIKTDPTKCVNSEQSSRGSDYMPCRVLDDESEMQDFCRKIRGQAIGILQRSQIIENEQRRKKKEPFHLMIMNIRRHMVIDNTLYIILAPAHHINVFC
nr:hypothetical transcript [Hymenolepis microstoma]